MQIHKAEVIKTIFVLALIVLGSKTKFSLAGVPLVFADGIIIAWSLYRHFPNSAIPSFLFLLMGSIGLPVFASGLTGAEAWSSRTAGYLAGYFLITLPLTGRKEKNGFADLLFRGVLLYLLLQSSGMIVYMQKTETDISSFLENVLLPFAPFGLLKVLLACTAVYLLKKAERKKEF